MPSIRQQINIAASPRTVWSALTTPDGLTAWWVDEARVDPRTGGRIVVGGVGDDGEPTEDAGIFLDFTPTRRIEIAWDGHRGTGPRTSRLSIQLARAADETRVVVVVSGGSDLDDEQVHGVLDKEWRASLRALREHLEG